MKNTILENVGFGEFILEIIKIRFSKPNFQMAKDLSGKNDWWISKSKTKTKYKKKLSRPSYMFKEY